MKPEISEINKRYLEIQDYVDPLSQDLIDFAQECTKEEWIEFQDLSRIYHQELGILRKNFMEIIDNSNPTEIAEAYTGGCRLLQRNLSGYMGNNFSNEYIPVMSRAIREKHFHTNWLFLQALANNIGKDVAPLAEYALELEPIQETALSVIGRLKLVNLASKVQEIANQTDNENQDFARHILAKLSE